MKKIYVITITIILMGALIGSTVIFDTIQAAPDKSSAPLKISNINVDFMPNMAIISWITNAEGEGTIEYGLSSGVYDDSLAGGSMTVVKNGFLYTIYIPIEEGETYYYKITFVDSEGSIAESKEKTFMKPSSRPSKPSWSAQPATPAIPAIPAEPGEPATSAIPATPATPPDPNDKEPPIISEIIVFNITEASATIIWNTDEYSDSVVEYGLATGSYDFNFIAYGDTVASESVGFGHSVSLNNLSASTTYHYKVSSTDNNGNKAESEDRNFTTSRQSLPSSVDYCIDGPVTKVVIGDVNNDGKDDIIAGNNKDAGSVTVYSGANREQLYYFSGEDYVGPYLTGSTYGEGLAVGDVNGDGYADIIFSANDSNEGSVYVYSGADGSLIHNFSGTGYYGDTLSSGDVNGDGKDDIIVGAWGYNEGIGAIFVFSGATGEELYRIDGEYSRCNFGRTTISAGDVNNDGYADIIAAINSEPSGQSRRISTNIYSGTDGSLIHSLIGGWWRATAGDTNGDGKDDILVGMTEALKVYVFSGATGEELHQFDGWGRVSTAGDVNNDGKADILSGNWGIGGRIVGSAGIRNADIYSGADGSLLYRFYGQTSNDGYADKVMGGGDINGDGNDDVVVIASNSIYGGSIYVYLLPK